MRTITTRFANRGLAAFVTSCVGNIELLFEDLDNPYPNQSTYKHKPSGQIIFIYGSECPSAALDRYLRQSRAPLYKWVKAVEEEYGPKKPETLSKEKKNQLKEQARNRFKSLVRANPDLVQGEIAEVTGTEQGFISLLLNHRKVSFSLQKINGMIDKLERYLK